MFRKAVLGLAAGIALVTSVFAPTAASAGHYGHGYRAHYVPAYTYYRPYCFTKKVYGIYGYRYVRVCR